ncbi:hypothetical protein TSTA_065650 [Talaromyces stipitatus ATCC 10500]|uniref:Uncharacterized protein n=1 Tax=Talaromyces stipitatus (strain ATCC 10500 / CBS 375.48 / QM 6759 / NRRL 1006) TaxID=441959 RepID=B8LV60_TALSN|nr:uncharacterized protein TSTA_065650 [Talaromyces stipitatus ATCC 10500]EED23110.1 hypothetical protein TSTA_065650 [Talaromyces stipitatus ATCC 10500]
MWTANLIFSSHTSEPFNSTFEFWFELSGVPRYGPIITFYFGIPVVLGYDLKGDLIGLVGRCGVYLQSYAAILAQWYNNQHELDEMHHYPVLTVPITLPILYIADQQLFWKDKPEHLAQFEHVIEETLLKNAMTDDFECQPTSVEAQINRVQLSLTEQSFKAGKYFRQYFELRDVNSGLYTELDQLRLSVDDNVHQARPQT